MNRDAIPFPTAGDIEEIDIDHDCFGFLLKEEAQEYFNEQLHIANKYAKHHTSVSGKTAGYWFGIGETFLRYKKAIMSWGGRHPFDESKRKKIRQ